MKFDMGAAWNAATALIGRNRNVIAIVAGVFFFLPYFAISMFLPTQIAPDVSASADPEVMLAAMVAIYAEIWWAILPASIIQGIGTLALLKLLTDRARPTVGEALKTGAIAFPSYAVANILSAVAIGAAVLLPVLLLPLMILLALPVILYLLVKFSLIMPVIAIEGVLNPINALARSWRLTKGNSFRLLLFYFLLLVALLVVTGLANMVLTLIFAAIGGQAELIGNAAATSLINALFSVIVLAVLAGVHRQLTGDTPQAISETFE
jgi:hypothetical protein